jgi:hypothetical protein
VKYEIRHKTALVQLTHRKDYDEREEDNCLDVHVSWIAVSV